MAVGEDALCPKPCELLCAQMRCRSTVAAQDPMPGQVETVLPQHPSHQARRRGPGDRRDVAVGRHITRRNIGDGVAYTLVCLFVHGIYGRPGPDGRGPQSWPSVVELTCESSSAQ